MDIINRIKGESFFIISACKGKADDEKRTAQLRAMLAAYAPVEALGVWQETQEASFVVFSSDHAQALKLAGQFEQTHLLTDHALIELATGKAQPVTGLLTGSEAAAQESHTIVGEKIFSFTLGG